MAQKRLELGRAAELVARRFLKKRGYRLLKANYSCPCGEIDIVARDGRCLVFVEVKSRRGQEYGPPEAALTVAKMGQLRKAAKGFLARYNLPEIDCRFDVVSVQWPSDAEKPTVELFKDAFRLDGMLQK